MTAVGSSAPDDQAAADRVATAVAELYGRDPQEFTDRRKALAADARAAGDTAAAKEISALRKPTRAAWVVNRLARDDPGAPARLADLAAALRAAEQSRDGPRLRELSAARGRLTDSLTDQALAAAGVADPPAGLREEVTATLTAALADPEVAAEFAAGTLTRAAQWAGFGLNLPAPGTDSDTEPAGSPALAEAAAKPSAATPAAREAASATPLEEGKRLLAERRRQERLAAEAAEAAARRRQAYVDAERAVASAAATAADAGAAEDRLEEEVRGLEERLTRARADLADARVRARRAEATERRARQVLDRTPRPEDRA